MSSIDGECGREIEDETDEEGRYDRRGEIGLGEPGGEHLKCTRRVARRLGVSCFSPTWAEVDHWEGVGLASS